MIQFFRKHQKKIFLLIGIITTLSFTFFGTFSTLNSQAAPAKKFFRAVDGSSIDEREMKSMVLFLSLVGNDKLRENFFDTGILSFLLEKSFKQSEQELKERFLKAQKHTFYSHPKAPFFGSTQVWNQFAPDLHRHLKQVQTSSFSLGACSTYLQLYFDQGAFPPELLRAILLHEGRKYSWLPLDRSLASPRLPGRDPLTLFGYQTFEDWFGPHLGEVLGKFIINTSMVLEKRGTHVLSQEAKADLMRCCYAALKSKNMQQEVSPREVGDFFRFQLEQLGIQEGSIVEMWRRVMVLHRFFQDVEQSVLLDPALYEQFSAFADAKVLVDVYQLPRFLQFKDFRSMLKLYYYLEAVSPQSQRSVQEAFNLPREFYSVEEVEKNHPQLVISRYELEMAKVKHEEVFSRFSLKEVWDFEMTSEGWTALQEQFPILKQKEGESREKILDEIDSELRQKCDRFARSFLVKKHPEWVEETLKLLPFEKMVVEIRSKGVTYPFEAVEDTTALRQMLQNGGVGEIFTFVAPDDTAYRIKIVQKPQAKEIATFEQGLQYDSLGELLDEKLKTLYTEARQKSPEAYLASDGSWKPFHEVKDQLGAYLYADLLKTISLQPLSFAEYASKRFEQMMEEAKQSIQKEQEESKFLKTVGATLVDQWRVVKNRQEIKRSDATALPKKEMFSSLEGSWSTILPSQGREACFFYLLKKEVADLSIRDQVLQGQKAIGCDLKKQIAQTLLEEVCSSVF